MFLTIGCDEVLDKLSGIADRGEQQNPGNKSGDPLPDGTVLS